MISAFGVDHGGEEFGKALPEYRDPKTKKKASVERRVLASAPITSTFHPIVAGKSGKKLRATGNQWGGSMAGTLAGSVVGGRAGGLVGGVAGSQAGLNRNQRKGYLKREQ